MDAESFNSYTYDGTYYRIMIDPKKHTLPPHVRKALHKHEEKAIRSNCGGAQAATDPHAVATDGPVWNDCEFTKTEIRFQPEKGAPWFAIPCPHNMAQFISDHDAGKALRKTRVDLDVSNAIRVSPMRKSRPGRHDLTSDGIMRPRKPRKPRKRTESRKFSRDGFTHPNF